MKNSYLQNLEEIIEKADDKTKWATWLDLKRTMSQMRRVEKVFRDHFVPLIGDKDSYEFEPGAGIYWQTRNYRQVPAEKALEIVEDIDTLIQIVTVDDKKAKEVLDEETYKEFKKNEVIYKSTKSLETGEIK